MYTEKDRESLLNQIAERMRGSDEFEGLLLIGSGAEDFLDCYSDIDLMAGCFADAQIGAAKEKLLSFFESLGAVYVDKRRWSDTVLGFSAYFENGLSADVSFMPTAQLRIRSPRWKLVFSKTDGFTDTVQRRETQRKETNRGMDDSVHHQFVYALRRCEIALLRFEFVYADRMLSDARQMLLNVEAMREGKDLHQFKAYNTLDADFLTRLEKTYPSSRTCHSLTEAKQELLALYLDTVKQCDFLVFDARQLKLLDCFA